MQEKATKLYVRVNATQPASGVALRFLIQGNKKSNILLQKSVYLCYYDSNSKKISLWRVFQTMEAPKVEVKEISLMSLSGTKDRA